MTLNLKEEGLERKKGERHLFNFWKVIKATDTSRPAGRGGKRVGHVVHLKKKNGRKKVVQKYMHKGAVP